MKFDDMGKELERILNSCDCKDDKKQGSFSFYDLLENAKDGTFYNGNTFKCITDGHIYRYDYGNFYRHFYGYPYDGCGENIVDVYSLKELASFEFNYYDRKVLFSYDCGDGTIVEKFLCNNENINYSEEFANIKDYIKEAFYKFDMSEEELENIKDMLLDLFRRYGSCSLTIFGVRISLGHWR